jgi:DNA-binding response OmpR family regulator
MAHGESVLVLEDNREIAAFIRTILSEQGFQLIEAQAGWKALELAEGMHPDVLLLDWQLPDITGLDVLRAVRAGHLQAPAILMTAYGSEELAMIALRLGVRDYLQKPFTGEDLLRAVEGALTEARLRREREALLAKLDQASARLDRYAQQVAHARDPIIKLAMFVDELELGRAEKVRIEEARHYIREVAQALEGPPHS